MQKVSVIIPSFNHASFLRQRIDSVINQTYKCIEIIILDDLSTDNSIEILQEYVSNKLIKKLIVNTENSGSTFRQWSKGFDEATGKYIWIAESDDYAHPLFLETLVAKMEADESVGLAYTQSWRVDENGSIQGNWEGVLADLDKDLWKQDFVSRGDELVRRFMVYRNIIPNASAVLMRASVVRQAGQPPIHMKVAGDWMFWINLLMITSVAFVAQPLNYFRFHQSNVRSKAEMNGTLLVEMAVVFAHALKVRPDALLKETAVRELIEKWYHYFIYYNLPKQKHYKFLSVMSKAYPGFKKIFLRSLLKILYRNNFSGTKMLIKDKLFRFIK